MNVLFRVFVSFGIVVFGPSAPFAQSGWFWQSRLPQGTHLRAAAVSDAQIATAVGDYGTILRPSDGGATWTLVGGTSEDLRGVSFVDANTGTAVGGSRTLPPFTPAVILRTTDGGATWTSQQSGTSFPLNAVSFVDANTRTAVWGTAEIGGRQVILRTVDGDATWTPQGFGVAALYGGYFVDANTGAAAGDRGTILNTTDGDACQ